MPTSIIQNKLNRVVRLLQAAESEIEKLKESIQTKTPSLGRKRIRGGRVEISPLTGQRERN